MYGGNTPPVGEIFYYNYNLYMVHASQKGWEYHINLIFSFLITYIIVPLYRRKFCDGRIILVCIQGVLLPDRQMLRDDSMHEDKHH